MKTPSPDKVPSRRYTQFDDHVWRALQQIRSEAMQRHDQLDALWKWVSDWADVPVASFPVGCYLMVRREGNSWKLYPFLGQQPLVRPGPDGQPVHAIGVDPGAPRPPGGS